MTTAGAQRFARVALRKNLARSIHAGHPWLYRDALNRDASKINREIPDGAIVLVTTSDGRPLGRGYWSNQTPIAVRMLVTEAALDIDATVRERLRSALTQRLSFIDTNTTSAFRWVHGEADRLPGLHLDVYGAFASVRFDGAGAEAFYRRFVDDIISIGASVDVGVTALVERRRGAEGRKGGAADGDNDAIAMLAGQPPAGVQIVRENGLAFEVDLLHGQKGGLFLDQRENRQWVRNASRDKRVLNLFGYTGGFSVYAAAGGARHTTTVDLAAGAIAAARRNFVLNGFVDERARDLIASDAFAFLSLARQKKTRWDFVISDPPSFAPNREAVPEALRAYRRLHRACAEIILPGGTFCAASCSSHVTMERFVESVEAGCAEAGRRFELLERHGAGADHPVASHFPEGNYLKFVVGTVR